MTFLLVETEREAHQIGRAVGRSNFCALHSRRVKSVMSCENCSVFWAEHSEERPNPFVGYVQVFTNKIATTLKTTVLVAYPVHVVLLFFSVAFQRWIIENWHATGSISSCLRSMMWTG